MTMTSHPTIYGIMAEYLTPEAVLAAARHVQGRGYRHMDAYSPFPVDGLAEAVNFRRNQIPLVVLIGGLVGGFGGFFMQWYSATIHYPYDVGGRPYNSWPMFIPITFELAVLIAALSAVLGMLGLNGLPRPHHPVFNVPEFELASRSRFFLCLQSKDPMFDVEATRGLLEETNPKEISVVPW
jgi:hypothetical protein